ncbi:hypothetical protein OUZ56_026436 [Daphnia magna]|uniref:Uncharacterized protein n=1 Tax=Daphnia magna TaxID=35525 RepID=A0ABQ9ZN36_9CRUS|nr:hypothetical protein OUZ56_026436 [Daphnia magna]
MSATRLAREECLPIRGRVQAPLVLFPTPSRMYKLIISQCIIIEYSVFTLTSNPPLKCTKFMDPMDAKSIQDFDFDSVVIRQEREGGVKKMAARLGGKPAK